MSNKIFDMPFKKIYPLLLNKALKKGRSEDEVNDVILWLTGYDNMLIHDLLESNISYAQFFLNAPCMNPKRFLITGKVCGVDVSEVEDPLMKEIRYLDKLIDELARGKSLDKIFRK